MMSDSLRRWHRGSASTSLIQNTLHRDLRRSPFAANMMMMARAHTHMYKINFMGIWRICKQLWYLFIESILIFMKMCKAEDEGFSLFALLTRKKNRKQMQKSTVFWLWNIVGQTVVVKLSFYTKTKWRI